MSAQPELPEVGSSQSSQTVLPIEQYFSVRHIAERLDRSEDTVRRLFKNEPGVLRIGKRRRNKRPYETLSIPESVLLRVVTRLQQRPGQPGQPAVVAPHLTRAKPKTLEMSAVPSSEVA